MQKDGREVSITLAEHTPRILVWVYTFTIAGMNSLCKLRTWEQHASARRPKEAWKSLRFAPAQIYCEKSNAWTDL